MCRARTRAPHPFTSEVGLQMGSQSTAAGSDQPQRKIQTGAAAATRGSPLTSVVSSAGTACDLSSQPSLMQETAIVRAWGAHSRNNPSSSERWMQHPLHTNR